MALSRAVESFVSDCEEVCGRRSTALRAALQTQAVKFVSRFHDERKTKLSLILDNERWKQADVPSDFQNLVNHINCTGRHPSHKSFQDHSVHVNVFDVLLGCLSVPDKITKSETAAPSEYLYVQKEKYAVVG